MQDDKHKGEQQQKQPLPQDKGGQRQNVPGNQPQQGQQGQQGQQHKGGPDQRSQDQGNQDQRRSGEQGKEDTKDREKNPQYEHSKP